jgi:hypothetical protein
MIHPWSDSLTLLENRPRSVEYDTPNSKQKMKSGTYVRKALALD